MCANNSTRRKYAACATYMRYVDVLTVTNARNCAEKLTT